MNIKVPVPTEVCSIGNATITWQDRGCRCENNSDILVWRAGSDAATDGVIGIGMKRRDHRHTTHPGGRPLRPTKLHGFLGVFGGFSVYSILEDFGIWMLPEVIKVVSPQHVLRQISE
jgi:hypothetical protein